MSKKHSQTETFHNSLCTSMGHDWAATTAQNYRHCQRDKCRATQRFDGKQWINVQKERLWIDPRIQYAKRQAMPKQVTLFQ